MKNNVSPMKLPIKRLQDDTVYLAKKLGHQLEKFETDNQYIDDNSKIFECSAQCVKCRKTIHIVAEIEETAGIMTKYASISEDALFSKCEDTQ